MPSSRHAAPAVRTAAVLAAALTLAAAPARAQHAIFAMDPEVRATAEVWAAQERFRALLPDHGVAGFDQLPVGTTAAALDFQGQARARLAGAGSVIAARYNAALGRTYRTRSPEPFATALRIDFDAPVHGFGLSAFSLNSQLSLTYLLADGRRYVWTPEPTGHQRTDADEDEPLLERAFFAGLLHPAGILAVELRVATDADAFEVDDLMVGRSPTPAFLATPEPATTALVGVGLAALVPAARRARR